MSLINPTDHSKFFKKNTQDVFASRKQNCKNEEEKSKEAPSGLKADQVDLSPSVNNYLQQAEQEFTSLIQKFPEFSSLFEDLQAKDTLSLHYLRRGKEIASKPILTRHLQSHERFQDFMQSLDFLIQKTM
jgi:hypothetical protein